jgi:succinate dehydrogenase / fumarate reductase membrane anchor subunit
VEHDKSRWIWLWQALSGVALIVLVGIHWVAQHYLAEGGLRTYAEVAAYLRQPLPLVLEAAFLIVVTGHALAGTRAILSDLGVSARVQRSIDVALWVAGILTVLYGLQLTWQIIHS